MDVGNKSGLNLDFDIYNLGFCMNIDTPDQNPNH